jgi:hypothetical protein
MYTYYNYLYLMYIYYNYLSLFNVHNFLSSVHSSFCNILTAKNTASRKRPVGCRLPTSVAGLLITVLLPCLQVRNIIHTPVFWVSNEC